MTWTRSPRPRPSGCRRISTAARQSGQWRTTLAAAAIAWSAPPHIAVRDSKNPEVGTLTLSPEAYVAFGPRQALTSARRLRHARSRRWTGGVHRRLSAQAPRRTRAPRLAGTRSGGLRGRRPGCAPRGDEGHGSKTGSRRVDRQPARSGQSIPLGGSVGASAVQCADRER
ncbi:DUF397 domain-containing protein [Streptomyces sp. HD]|nr:DUF397 domain-containing protein [Streptomyces sp. HD]MDC0770478.1 DUF397 domain-containing protein [Streptomyces sp. HD]